MAGFDNEVLFCPGERLEPSNAQSISLMQDSIATNVSRINFVGDPNGLVAANPSSICHDPVSGFFYLKVSGTGTTVWSRILPSTSTTNTLTPDFDFDGTAATPVVPQAGNVNVLSYNPPVANVINTYNSTGTATGNLQVEDKAWLTALVVDPSTTIGSRGTFSTIQSAITAASSGQTIFIRSGTYTENLTLKAGVNLTAFESSSSLYFTGNGQVIISGTCTMTTAGSVTISGIQLQTNGAAFLSVTGSAASIISLNNCFLNCSNATGIVFSSSSGSSNINIAYCTGNLGTTGIGFFSHSSAGSLNFLYCSMYNTGSSLASSTCSSGSCALVGCTFKSSFTTSSTAALGVYYTDIDLSILNITVFTVGGSGTTFFINNSFWSGSASTVSISSTMSILGGMISSSNTNAITGAGALIYSGIIFRLSAVVNVTTLVNCGTMKGLTNTTPGAGFLGERVSSTVLSTSPVTLTNGNSKTVTSISLSPGVWDISAIEGIQTATTGTIFALAISTVSDSFTGTVNADSVAITPTMPTATAYSTLTIPSFRAAITTTTTYYMIALCSFTVGAPTAFGRLSAVRVG